MALITRTFLSKTNTIVHNDKVNLGLNPIMELYYGSTFTRGLLYFDINNLKNLYIDKTYPDLTKLTHRLKMQNVGGIGTLYKSKYNIYNNAKRAKSFDLVFFLIDKEWDMGGGFDYQNDGFDTINKIYSTDGSNWFNANNTTLWNENGIMSDFNIEKNIIAKQHFDIGNESIDVDLTDVINDMILEKIENYGIGIAFIQELESKELNELNYVGFFTNHTHTFFKPYIESIYNETIEDDRTNFYLNKNNKLYFYASVGENRVNLDELPICTLNGEEMAVKQATKGVYYIDVNFNSNEYETETMFYDIWHNLKYNKQTIPDQELYFTTKPYEQYFKFGLPYETKKNEEIIPVIYGVNHKENILQGDIRKVNIINKIPYTTKQQGKTYKMFYRLYANVSDSEINVINWQPINVSFNENYFLINTKELVEGNYHIDIKYIHNLNEIIHKDLCEFNIINNNKFLKR